MAVQAPLPDASVHVVQGRRDWRASPELRAGHYRSCPRTSPPPPEIRHGPRSRNGWSSLPVFGHWIPLVVWAGLFVPMVVHRILIEEPVLFELNGYGDYAKGRKRLVPLLW